MRISKERARARVSREMRNLHHFKIHGNKKKI